MKRRHLSLLAALLLTGCGMFRPSFEEANEKLVGLVEPAIEAGLRGVAEIPEPGNEPRSCSDPFYGPLDGVQPSIGYRFPIALIEGDGQTLISRVERVWQDLGLEVRESNSPGVARRFSGTRGYSLSLTVNSHNEEVILGGTGPCVDKPEGMP